MARQWPGISSFSRRTTRARLAGRRGGLASLGSTRLLNTDSAVGGIVLPVVLPAGGGAVDRVARIGSGSVVIIYSEDSEPAAAAPPDTTSGNGAARTLRAPPCPPQRHQLWSRQPRAVSESRVGLLRRHCY